MQSKAKLGFTATTSRQAKRGSGNLVNTVKVIDLCERLFTLFIDKTEL